MREIDEIWIIEQSGLTLFNLSKEDSLETAMIGGFFAALQSMLESIGEKQIKSIILGESKIIIYNGSKGLLYISRSKRSVKDKNIEQHLKLVEKKFIEEYEDKLDPWDGNLDYFKGFGQKIEDIFKDTPEKRAEKALW
ncbi:MAG: hypothetical protein ACTSO9_07225 [Candidatus Helarchaeota archaeon]